MGLFNRLGRGVEEFRQNALSAAEESMDYECADCGAGVPTADVACAACGSEDVFERAPPTDEEE